MSEGQKPNKKRTKDCGVGDIDQDDYMLVARFERLNGRVSELWQDTTTKNRAPFVLGSHSAGKNDYTNRVHCWDEAIAYDVFMSLIKLVSLQ